MNQTNSVVDAFLSEMLGQASMPGSHPGAHYLILAVFAVLCSAILWVSTKMFAVEIKTRNSHLPFHTEHVNCDTERNVIGPMLVGLIALVLLLTVNFFLAKKFCPERTVFVCKGGLGIFCSLLMIRALQFYYLTGDDTPVSSRPKVTESANDSTEPNHSEEPLGKIVSISGKKTHPSLPTYVTVHYQRPGQTGGTPANRPES
jgi:hypothetical protein